MSFICRAVVPTGWAPVGAGRVAGPVGVADGTAERGGVGAEQADEDVARLSPLGHAHLNCLGRYAIASSAPDKGLRPLVPLPLSEDRPATPVDEDGV
ncbi:transposase [Sphaerisporangium perillae]|uniref:transposase n=1 Tax=Sphaerisporangium perillae TaxID=2935860 RepID=UPI00200EA254|nr:transposase [Sphaerisporangium perillae]